jgi:hypothetical protein
VRVGDVLRELGRPIAYYPYLSRYLGGVNASVLFCQIFYWQDKATSELGVHKTSAELQAETGLSYEEQRAARASLRSTGVLIETEKRIEHKIYFRIDGCRPSRPRKSGAKPGRKSPLPRLGKVHLPKWEKSIPGNRKSPIREMGKVHLPKWTNPIPRTRKTPLRRQGTSLTAEREVPRSLTMV